jgi:hypothetical protein
MTTPALTIGRISGQNTLGYHPRRLLLIDPRATVRVIFSPS